MKVIHHEPLFWFFIKDKNSFFIDVNCSHSFFGFTVLIELDEIEVSQYRIQGKQYLNDLANNIQYYALYTYKDRNKSNDKISESIDEVIMTFKKVNNV
ncbi:hypothetical protein [Algoriella sp.]|uniref:hypothetical protein n=1 Tax=Algoriella sp. TaxID=1872434 RepID=UPI002FC81E11